MTSTELDIAIKEATLYGTSFYTMNDIYKEEIKMTFKEKAKMFKCTHCQFCIDNKCRETASQPEVSNICKSFKPCKEAFNLRPVKSCANCKRFGDFVCNDFLFDDKNDEICDFYAN